MPSAAVLLGALRVNQCLSVTVASIIVIQIFDPDLFTQVSDSGPHSPFVRDFFGGKSRLIVTK